MRWAAEDALSHGRRDTPRPWAEPAGQTNGRGEGETTEENQRLEDSPEHGRDSAVGLAEVPWAESTGTQNPAGPTGGFGGPGPARGWGGRPAGASSQQGSPQLQLHFLPFVPLAWSNP